MGGPRIEGTLRAKLQPVSSCFQYRVCACKYNLFVWAEVSFDLEQTLHKLLLQSYSFFSQVQTVWPSLVSLSAWSSVQSLGDEVVIHLVMKSQYGYVTTVCPFG